MSEAPGALTPDERAELERLRGEVATLRAQSSGRAGRAGRWVAAIALLVVSGLLFTTSVLAVFVRTQLLDTDRYVETVAPLIQEPAIQQAIATRVTNAIVTQLDLEQRAQELAKALEARGAPEAIDLLVGPAVSGLTSFIRTQVQNVVSSERFAQFWESANRTAHQELDALLTTGQGQLLTAQGTQVSLNLGSLIELVKQRLIEGGFSLASKIPQISLTLPLFESAELPKLRTYVSWLNTAAWLLPVLAAVFLLAGVLVAPNRRRGLLIGSSILAVGMLVLLGAMSAVRTYYLNHLPNTTSPEVARLLFDTEVRFLVKGIETLLVLFISSAVLCWLAGQSGPARWVKRVIDAVLDGLAGVISRTDVPIGPVPGWLRQARRPIIVGVIVLAVAILVLWGQPGIAGVLWVTFGALVVLAAIEIVARTTQVEPGPAARPAVA